MKHFINEDLLFNRHRKIRKDEQMAYEFTTDEGYLQQYYTIRSLIYKRRLGVDIPARADAFDPASKILVARLGNQVIAGVRVMAIEPDSRNNTLLNLYGAKACKFLRSLDAHHARCCEIFHYIISEEFQNTEIITKINRALNDYILQNNFAYSFIIALPNSDRLNRIYLKRLDINAIHTDDANAPEANRFFGDRFTFIISKQCDKPATKLLNASYEVNSHLV